MRSNLPLAVMLIGIVVASCSRDPAGGNDRGPCVTGLSAQADDGAIVAHASTVRSTIDPGYRETEPPAVGVRFELLDDGRAVVDTISVEETGRDVAVRFSGLVNGRPYTLVARAVDASGTTGWPREVWTVPGPAPAYRMVRERVDDVAVSHDGGSLLLSVRDPALELVLRDIAAGSEVTIYRPDGEYVESLLYPRWLPWDTSVSFVSVLPSFEVGLFAVPARPSSLPPDPIHVSDSFFWPVRHPAMWLPDILEPETSRLWNEDGWFEDVTVVGWQRESAGSWTSLRKFAPYERPHEPVYSPDGHLLAYVLEAGGRMLLVIEEAEDGLEVSRIDLGYASYNTFPYYHDLAWFPDGGSLVVSRSFASSHWHGVQDVWRYDILEESWMPITGYAGQITLDWVPGLDVSPDGERLYVCSGNLYEIDVP